MKWYKLPDTLYAATPFIKKIKVGNKSICLVGYEGVIFAVAAACPHAGFDLSEGLCVKGKIICPYHRYSYSLTTGKGGEGQNDFVETYPVNVKDNHIYVGISSLGIK